MAGQNDPFFIIVPKFVEKMYLLKKRLSPYGQQQKMLDKLDGAGYSLNL